MNVNQLLIVLKGFDLNRKMELQKLLNWSLKMESIL